MPTQLEEVEIFVNIQDEWGITVILKSILVMKYKRKLIMSLYKKS